MIDALRSAMELLREEVEAPKLDPTLPIATDGEKQLAVEVAHATLTLLHDRLQSDQVQREQAIDVVRLLRDGMAELLKQWGPT